MFRGIQVSIYHILQYHTTIFPKTMLSPPSTPLEPDMSFDTTYGGPITLSPDRMALGHRRNLSTGSISSDDSDDTIDLTDLDDDSERTIGFPLQRMIPYDILSPTSSQTTSDGEENQGEDANEDDDDLTALYKACMTARLESHHSAEDADSDSDSETSSVAWDDVDFEQLVDLLPEKYREDSSEEEYVQLHPSSCRALSAPLTVHSLRLPGNLNPLAGANPLPERQDDSSILLLFLALNTPELRSDPWNPVPRILRAVERTISSTEHVGAGAGSMVYLFHPPLVPFTQESKILDEKEEQGTVAQWIDFFRQVLEGVTFLHENGVVWGGFNAIEPLPCPTKEPSRPPGLDTGEERGVEMFMMDISADPEAFVSGIHTEWTFDRSRYPVKYYFTNFRRARQISAPITTLAPSPSSPFTKEIQSCGEWLETLIQDIHLLTAPLLPLTQAMTSGTFTADGARKLFEARIRSRDKLVWDKQIASVRWRPLSRPRQSPTGGISIHSDVQRAQTLHVTRAASRPGFGSSRTRVTETSATTFSMTAPRPLASIARSKSNPIPILQENIRKDVFGDLSFVKSVGVTNTIVSPALSEEPIAMRLDKSADLIPPSTSPATSNPFNFLSHGTNSPASFPAFTIPSLITFPSSSPLSSLPESTSSQPEQNHNQQSSSMQNPRRRKTLALGTGIFLRKSSYSGPQALGAQTVTEDIEEDRGYSSSGIDASVPSRPGGLLKIGRSLSMPLTGSGTWAKS
ncbi:hypothetical protein F5878DRAFT_604428 [Lentinula raphanica]|uniref:Uncharacterized protein n=1 Tax=Lentinula raphanica TaxID=153919 RepID=A0AA38PIZ3_9AGAR|nr:hypothetical protein F5878DRAFT_604428 [Lentinula raphanica]